jgi:hypothetical protein
MTGRIVQSDSASSDLGVPGQPTEPRMRTSGRGRFGFVYQDAMRDAGMSYAIQTDLRLFLLCAARAGNSGHAMFEPGELARKLAKPNRTTGEVRPFNRTTVRDAINRLVSCGLVADLSTAQCVVLVHRVWERRFGGTPYCRVHNTRSPWRGNTWGEQPPDDFQGL